MALGSEGFFSPEGLQGGEKRGRGKGEQPLWEVGERGARVAAPQLPSPHSPRLKGPHFEKPELSQGEQLSSQGGTVLSSTHHPLHSLLSSCLHHHAKYFHSHYSLVLEGI